MIGMDVIREYSQRIEREFHPNRIVLFGSYARGIPTPDSDVDLLVVMPFTGKPWHAASAIRRRLQPPFPLDLLVRTPEQVDERLRRGDTYLEALFYEGVVLHES